MIVPELGFTHYTVTNGIKEITPFVILSVCFGPGIGLACGEIFSRVFNTHDHLLIPGVLNLAIISVIIVIIIRGGG